MKKKYKKTDSSQIDELKKSINRRGPYKPDTSRADFSQPRVTVKDDWQSSEDEVAPEQELPQADLMPIDINNTSEVKKEKHKVSPLLKKLFYFSIIFFIFVVIVSVFIVLSGKSVVSSNNIDIAIEGPTSISGGDTLELALGIANRNSVPIEFVDLGITFPSGTRSAVDTEEPMLRYRKNLGKIKSGEIVNERVEAVIFGQSGTEEEIIVSLDYRTADSNAILRKEKVYTLLISSSPLDIAVSLPENINSGTEVEVGIDISSGSTDVLQDILVEVTYPSGFRFTSSNPQPTYSNNAWFLGDLSKDRARSIDILGTVEGQNGEQKLFRINTGSVSTEREDKIGRS